MKIIHWVGAGLSSGPGIERLIMLGCNIVIWNRTKGKADDISNGRAETREYSLAGLNSCLKAGDIVVSMLPAGMHLDLVSICIEKNCHFVCSSYLAPEVESFHEKAKLQGLSIVTEVGLDPGIDHIFAHILISQSAKQFAGLKNLKIQFRSFCGGLPKIPGDFFYKFSWSPLGVLKALKAAAKWIEGGEIRSSTKPRTQARAYSVDLGEGSEEEFEVLPNRDSLNYISEYNLPSDWEIETFIRGTLRYKGWGAAWKEIFNQVENSEDPEVLNKLSGYLGERYMFAENEMDRVVLVVELSLRNAVGQLLLSRTLSMNVYGQGRNTAMAKLVSLPVSFAVEDILKGVTAKGVSRAPDDANIYSRWIEEMENSGLYIQSNEVIEEYV